MSNITKRAAFIGAFFLALVCGVFGVAGCANEQSDAPVESRASSVSEATGASGPAGAPAEITAQDVREYCGLCHFEGIENAPLSSFNKDTVDKAMVESMIPTESDETIQALADYFARIEPSE